MSDPTDRPRRSGRHSGDGGERSAADFLASWRSGELPAVADDATGPVTDSPRGARQRAEETAEEETAEKEAAAREAPAREAAGRPSTPVPARPTSRSWDPADDEATRRTPRVAPATTEMPAAEPPRPVASSRSAAPSRPAAPTRAGTTGAPVAGASPRSHAAAVLPPAPVLPPDDEPTDWHARVEDDAPGSGPVLYDQELDAASTGPVAERGEADPRDAPAAGHDPVVADLHGDERSDDADLHDGHHAGEHPLDGHHADEHPLDDHRADDHRADDHRADDHRADDDPAAPVAPVWDQTGGLEVIGAEVEEERGGRGRRSKGAGRPPRKRRARRPITIVVSLLVLVGLVGGIVVGGQWLISKVNPTAADYTGQGSGDVQVRVMTGDSLTAIGQTLVEADVIASTGPFVDAASADPAATGIQPGLYGMRLQMSGQAALDLLLDPASRLLSRVTIPEGFTVAQTLQRLAEATQTPLADLQAAAADTTQLGLPAWADGQLEGFLYPLTYDFEPGTTPVQMLQAMVAQFTTVATHIQLEARAAAAGRTPYEVLTVASMVQSETLQDAERVDVAQVIYNRLAAGTPLGIDATLAYGLDKNGNDLTVADLGSDNPYNTRVLPGLPPTAISSPGELSLEAALAPSTGGLLYYVLQDTEGNHFFTSDYQEFLAARDRCAQAGLGCGSG